MANGRRPVEVCSRSSRRLSRRRRRATGGTRSEESRLGKTELSYGRAVPRETRLVDSLSRPVHTSIVVLGSATRDRNKQDACSEQQSARGPPLPDDPHRLSTRLPDARRTEWPRRAISSR